MAIKTSGQHRLLRREPGALLWEQLLADLRRRLDADEFTNGFPGEHALVSDYGVSRQTVRQAVQVLRQDGLVVAGRGRPSRQAEPVEIAQRLDPDFSEGALYERYAELCGVALTADFARRDGYHLDLLSTADRRDPRR